MHPLEDLHGVRAQRRQLSNGPSLDEVSAVTGVQQPRKKNLRVLHVSAVLVSLA